MSDSPRLRKSALPETSPVSAVTSAIDDGMEGDIGQQVLSDMQRWLERAVIGLNLCPFARAAMLLGQIRWRVSAAGTAVQVLDVLDEELTRIAAADAQRHDTTLLVLPRAFADFSEFNQFFDAVDACLSNRRLVGTFQVASFHPDYQFAGEPDEDMSHYTNRAPYPTLHLLREASIERAVAGIADPADIYEANIVTLRRLGPEGWQRLWLD